MNDDPTDNPGVLIFPPLLFVICLVCGTIAYLVYPFRLAFGPLLRGSGALLVLAGVALAIWGQRTMKAAGTNIHPNLPATAVVSQGPFAFTRNPLYVSLLATFAGIGVALSSLTFLAVLVPFALVLHFGVVLREERYLEAKFGDAYRSYKSSVSRWI